MGFSKTIINLSKRHFLLFCFTVFAYSLVSCNSSDVKNAVDLADGVERKQIDYNLLGINAFANDGRFGTSSSQLSEVRDTLRLNRVRLLMNWDDNVQPSPDSQLNFSFYDQLISSVPSGVEILVVATAIPSWMKDSSNWINNNPRETFVKLFFSKLIVRYPQVTVWQLWNEPNAESNSDNSRLEFIDSPANYVEMLALADSQIDQLAPGKKLINAATTAINQNYPESLNYNRAMRDAGAQSFVDAWAIHYYGKQYENVQRSGGVADFLNGLDKLIWITESGAQGVNNQLDYAERTWPFLKDNIEGLERIFIYQFTEATSPESTYGLKNLDSTLGLSDLYVHLRDR